MNSERADVRYDVNCETMNDDIDVIDDDADSRVTVSDLFVLNALSFLKSGTM